MPTRRKRSMTEADVEDDRKARKRATDRRAQRDHRQRRKAYVKELEDSVQSLAQQHTSEDRVKSLLEENGQLREQCARLRAKLNQIQSIASTTSATAEGETLGLHPGSDSPATRQNPEDNSTTVDLREAETLHDVGEVDLCPDGQQDATCHSSAVLDVDGLGAAHDFCTSGEFELATSSIEDVMGNASCNDTAVDATVDLGEFDFDTAASTSVNPIINAASPISTFLSDLGLSKTHVSQEYLQFPRYSDPVGLADRAITNFLNEARREHQQAKFDDSEPSLTRLLSDPPQTVLAFRLFHFISRAGPMPLHLFLGIFWVQYLVLRWMVLGTQAAYMRIPKFMRPTPLECSIPHRTFVSMIVWPDIRQSLIRDGDFGDPEAVGVDMLEHLSSRWDMNGPKGDAAVASMGITNVVEKQAEEPDFWAMDSGFFARYPQFSNCRPPLPGLLECE